MCRHVGDAPDEQVLLKLCSGINRTQKNRGKGNGRMHARPNCDSGALLPPTPCYTGVHLTAELPSGLGEIYSASVNNPNSSC